MDAKDIKRYTKIAAYAVEQPWDNIESWISRRADNGTLELDPEFQRIHVWTPDQQTRYIEHILRGGQSGKDIYFNQADWMRGFKAPMYLVDGKQRLQAIRKFMNNEVAIFGGYVKSEITGISYFDAAITLHVNDLPTYTDVVQWYIDLNAGGTPHTEAEIEKARLILINAK